MNVFVLATCRKPELAAMTRLVFATLRVGFPTAAVTVFLNGPDCEANCTDIRSVAESAQCKVVAHEPTIHHKWIEKLTSSETEPFFILDTDVVFYEIFERFSFTTALAGWRIPEWKDEFTKTITRARLHTSLLYIDPVKVRDQVAKYQSRFPVTDFNPLANLFYPLCLPLKEEGHFYDTCGMLYHAIGGAAFTDEQLDCLFHFNFGTISDIVIPLLSNPEKMEWARHGVLNNTELGRGAWRQQMEYYSARPAIKDGKNVIAPINTEDAAEATRWNTELCQGNREAMTFCDMWYQYCHGIDDLIDTMEDGRPVMSKEQIISLFLKAAIFYNSPFFTKHRDLLFPIAIQTTNTYADSVAWERSPKKHLRIMADVFRTCGNDMYFMVALLCGGEAHMRSMSKAIRERDWIGQHDANGNTEAITYNYATVR